VHHKILVNRRIKSRTCYDTDNHNTFLTLLSVKERMCRGPMCLQVQIVKMLTLIGGLCCVEFINPNDGVAGVWKQTSFI
jgi:hypothetical protein